MWPSIGLASTIFASIVRHCAPNAAEPCAVIKSTTWVAGRDGGMTGSGGGGPAGAAGGGAGAAETAEITSGTTISAAHAASAPRSSLRISLSLAAVGPPRLFGRNSLSLASAQILSRREHDLGGVDVLEGMGKERRLRTDQGFDRAPNVAPSGNSRMALVV